MKIRLICYQDVTGYGMASTALYRALKKQPQLELSFIKFEQGNPRSPVVVNTENINMIADITILHAVPEYYPYWIKKERQINPDIKFCAYTTWETSALPAHWPHLINQADLLWVPCLMNLSLFERSGVQIPISVVPHIYHDLKNIGREWLRSKIQIPKETYIFYTIGEWAERKNIPALMRAFDQAFKPDEAVALLIKTGTKDWSSYKRRLSSLMLKSPGSSIYAFKRLKKKLRNKNIYLLTEKLSNEEILEIHKGSHCFVSLTRGEGFGMGAFEAAWQGNPVMITLGSGYEDFLPYQHTYYINAKKSNVKASFGKTSYTENQEWLDPDIAHATQTFQRIFKEQLTAKTKGAALANYVKENFNDTKIINECLKTLYACKNP